jgi:hypothetical protein
VDFLKYVYSCAMPPGSSLTLTLHHTDADGGVIITADGGASTEQVVLEGKHGLAPEWGADDHAVCNDDCKRWVSACLLARTNAYGQHVNISLRAPRSIWNPLIPAEKDALDRTQYLVMSTPGGPDGGGCRTAEVPTAAARRATDYPCAKGPTGNVSKRPWTATASVAPKYYACAGPANSIPQLTSASARQGTPASSSPAIRRRTTRARMKTENRARHGEQRCLRLHRSRRTQVPRGPHRLLAEPVPVCGNHVCEGPTHQDLSAGHDL